jgi:hypothetical protein
MELATMKPFQEVLFQGLAPKSNNPEDNHTREDNSTRNEIDQVTYPIPDTLKETIALGIGRRGGGRRGGYGSGLTQARQFGRDCGLVREVNILPIDSVSRVLCVLPRTIVQHPSRIGDPNERDYWSAELRKVTADIEIGCAISRISDSGGTERIGLATCGNRRSLEVFLHGVIVVYVDQWIVRRYRLKHEPDYSDGGGIESYYGHIEVIASVVPELEVGRIDSEVWLVRLAKLNIRVVIYQKPLYIGFSGAQIKPRRGLGLDLQWEVREGKKDDETHNAERPNRSQLLIQSKRHDLDIIPATEITHREDSGTATDNSPEPQREKH